MEEVRESVEGGRKVERNRGRKKRNQGRSKIKTMK